MNRYFDLYLTAGHSVPVVINANQYDSSETWIFTLYTEDDQLYTPASGSIVGLKSDGHTIANAGTVNNDGQVVIQETVQITAAKGINVFELVLDGNHGTANFVVLVEPRPGDNVTPSDSELTLMEQAIAAAGSIEAVSVLQETVNSVAGRMDEFISSHAGLANETILWEGTLGGTGSVTLSEDASAFDTIAIYTQAQSNFVADTASEAHYFKASDLIANNAIVTVAVANTFTQASPATAVISAEVGISGTQNKTFDLIAWKNVRWSGVATDDAEIAISVSGAVIITKVVGIKNEQADTEVLDARVGADGTIYSNLEQRLNAENSALKSAIAQGSGLTNEAKTALLELLQHVAYVDDDGQDYYDALETALNPPTNLSYISAVYAQGSTIVYDTDSLDSLRSNLVVTAHYDDLTTETVTSYTLSGTLTEGTSTITVAYGGKTTTFNVTVTHNLYGWYYEFNNSIASSGTKDFNLTGTANYTTGVNGDAYRHNADTGTSTALMATALTDYPVWNGDFTIGVWAKSITEANRGVMISATKAYTGVPRVYTALSAFTLVDSSWTITDSGTSANGFSTAYAGFRLFWLYSQAQGKTLNFSFFSKTPTDGILYVRVLPPSSFNSMAWHHYAVTRSGSTIRLFVDGNIILTATCGDEFYSVDQIAFGTNWSEYDSSADVPVAYPFGIDLDDVYINDKSAKWTSNFDPSSIVY